MPKYSPFVLSNGMNSGNAVTNYLSVGSQIKPF